jgi:hypothetical protein
VSFETSTQHFDVVGSGYVAEHTDEKHRHLIEAEKNAVGSATAWLAFYTTAVVVVVVITNFHKVANIGLAGAN